jgi:hypothetical protein
VTNSDQEKMKLAVKMTNGFRKMAILTGGALLSAALLWRLGWLPFPRAHLYG